MSGAGEAEYRGPMPWNHPPYDLRAFFQRLAALRREDDLLALGSWQTLCAEGRLYAYERRLGNRAVTVALNAGYQPARLDSRLPSGEAYLSQGWSKGELGPFGCAVWRET